MAPKCARSQRRAPGIGPLAPGAMIGPERDGGRGEGLRGRSVSREQVEGWGGVGRGGLGQARQAGTGRGGAGRGGNRLRGLGLGEVWWGVVTVMARGRVGWGACTWPCLSNLIWIN